jgi:PPM family protein phosphatase
MAASTGDVILLCTDGLYRQVDDLAIERVLLDLAEPAEAGLTLINLANRRGGADNIAVVVARPEGDDLRSPGSGDALENQNVP